MSRYEEEIVDSILREKQQLRNNRVGFELHWNDVAELVLPTYRNTFMENYQLVPGEKKTEKQVDSTAALALSRFAAILDSLLTPRNMKWHELSASDPNLNKDRSVRLWFDEVTRRLFQARYSPTANFSSQNQQVYQSLGAFGTGCMFLDEFQGMEGEKGLRYKAIPLGEMYLRENHQGLIDGFLRDFRLTVRQAYTKWGDTLPDNLMAKLKANPESLTQFYHCVRPRTDYDPLNYGIKGKPYGSYYVSVEGKKLMSEGGYRTLPLIATRYDQAPGEVYGRGPAMMVLPAIKVLNAEKRTVLKQGHRAVDFPLLTHDDGALSLSMLPGAQNPGTVNSDGKPLVIPLLPGQVQIGQELMNDERLVINDAFLVSLFQVLTESPQMSATEVVERSQEKGILLAPTVGRQQSEYLGPQIDRELDIMTDLNMLPPMPPALQEAAGEYQVVYTSPLARAARSQEVSGLLRTVESSLNVVQATGDPAPLDHFDWDVIVPEVADIQGVPTRWMRDPRMIAAMRQQRADRMQQQQEVQAAPGAAALIKANAVAQQGKGK